MEFQEFWRSLNMKLVTVKYCVQYTTYIGLAVRQIEDISIMPVTYFLKGIQKYLWISNSDLSNVTNYVRP